MGQYTVNHACGCRQKHQLFGKIDGRERMVAALENTACDECSAKMRAEKAKSEPNPLVGSDRQVSWASDIRRKAVSFLDGFEAKINALPPGSPEDKVANARKVLADLRAAVDTQTSASWWIDHKHVSMTSVSALAKMFGVEIK